MATKMPAGKAEAPAAKDSGKKPAESQEALLRDIERTRAELGASLEALVAKADVKALARKNANDMSARLRSRMEQARGQASARATRVRGQFAGTMAGARHMVPSSGNTARHRARGGTAAAGATAWQATPDGAARPRRAGWAQQAAGRAASVAMERPVVTAAAVATATVALEYLAVALLRRR